MLKALQNHVSRIARTIQCSRRAPSFRSFVASMPKPLKLHLACGNVHLTDWVNIDGLRTMKGHDVLWDLRDPLPLPSDCSSLIFHEHFLEHLEVADGLRFLKECYRLLQPGGVMRVAMPDLKVCVDDYFNDNWREQHWVKQHNYSWIQTGAEYLNICMRDWEHKWLYDRKELHRRLKEAGFNSVQDCQNGQSEIPELHNIESRIESYLVVEAKK